MLALSKVLDVDLWMNIPHLADDEYVKHMAALVRSLVPEHRRVYVEWSNEVWNSIFPQAEYAKYQGIVLGLGADAFTAQLRFYALRSLQVFSYWNQAFADRPDQLVTVLAGQSANPWTAEQILGFKEDAAASTAGNRVDAYATAPYFGHQSYDAAPVPDLGYAFHDQFLSLPTVVGMLESMLDDAIDQAAANSAIASSYALPHILYEGGQHITTDISLGALPSYLAYFSDLNRSPEMGTLYSKYIDRLFTEANVSNAVLYKKMSRWGPGWVGFFGLLERQDDWTPKWEAVLAAAEATLN
jgi:hypothetical protein